MSDPKVMIAAIVAIAAVIVIVVLFLRGSFTGGKVRINKKGIDASVSADPSAAPPVRGVDLSGAKFKNENEFTADNEARVKAQNLSLGDRNKIRIGDAPPPASDEENR